MPTGTIKKLVADRGFGFIAAEDGKEFFFHRSGTEGDFDSLRGGEKVTFEIEASPKGPRARSVRTGGVPGSITFPHRWQISVFWGSGVAFCGSCPGA